MIQYGITLGQLKELIAELEREKGEKVLDMKVLTEYDYGDYCHTRALEAPNKLMVVTPHKSGYSQTRLALKTVDEDDEDDEEYFEDTNLDDDYGEDVDESQEQIVALVN